MLNFINMKKFLKENLCLIILLLLSITLITLFLGHYKNIILDVGREVYYPQRILEGKVLYKDLFVIYGPFAYLFNAFLYKIFGIKLSTLYFSGICTSLLLVTGFYLVAKKFLSEFLSISVGIFAAVIGISGVSLFNYTFPYSWDILYGMTAFTYSVLFLLKFLKEQKNSFLYLSALLCGTAFICKYEFLLYSLLFMGYSVYLSFKAPKTGIKAVCSFLSIPAIAFGFLFLQGLRFEHLVNSIKIVDLMSKSQTLKYFYGSIGFYFHPKILILLCVFFLKSFICLSMIISGFFVKEKRPFAGTALIFVSLPVIIFLLSKDVVFVLSFVPLLLFILCLVFYKSLIKNKYLTVIVLCSLLVSLKTFWGMTIGVYSTFYAAFVLIGLWAFLFKFIDKKYMPAAGIYMLCISVLLLLFNFKNYEYLTEKIETQRGKIYTYTDTAKSSNELISYINSQTKNTDKIVILPEGMIINFLTNRKSDDWYNSFLPLYFETFGEEKIIEHFKNNKPEYFVLNNTTMVDYGFNNICNDYGFGLCSFIAENYTHVKTFDNGFRYLVYKRK